MTHGLILQKIASRSPEIQNLLKKRLPEIISLEALFPALQDIAQIQIEDEVDFEGIQFPLYSISIGATDPQAPVLAFFAGVHGLERIGASVAIAWLRTLIELMRWDRDTKERLCRSRIVFMPIVNPVGVFRRSRSNGADVDLMRNAPVQAEEPPPFLLGGQRISHRLPWYRGRVQDGSNDLSLMESETQAVARLAERLILNSPLSMSVDIHSGFGMVDRLWFPYAKALRPPPFVAEVCALKQLFDQTYPNHFYEIEPQAKQYTTHGDLWDWLLDRKIERGDGLYIPWTLELGSWIWLKKNPIQAMSILGAFNPIKPHRLKRVMRRHVTLFDFLHRVLLNPSEWVQLDALKRDEFQIDAKQIWY
jgi:hypothetical protein